MELVTAGDGQATGLTEFKVGIRENLASAEVRGDLEPGFKIDHFLKDLGIALAEAGRLNIALPGTALAEQLYRAARAQGYGQKGTQALAAALAAINKREAPRTS